MARTRMITAKLLLASVKGQSQKRGDITREGPILNFHDSYAVFPGQEYERYELSLQ